MEKWTLLVVFALAATVAYGADFKFDDYTGLQTFDFPKEIYIPPPKQQNNVCINQQLKHCQANFNKDLGIVADNADWTNPQILVYALNKMYKKGIDTGFLPVCNARVKFYQCLGTSYNACMNRLTFIARGYSEVNATKYVQVFKQLDFECNAGSIQMTQKYDCIQAVRYSDLYNTTYNNCVNVFNKNISTTHGDPAIFCASAQQLGLCLSSVFATKCGTDTAWWECENVRSAFQVDGYCPQLTCVHGVWPNVGGGNVEHSMPRHEVVAQHFGNSEAAKIFHEVVGAAYKRLRK